MDIQKEIKISEKTTPVFLPGTEMGELYRAMVKRWKLHAIDAFDASLFYSLGRAHGIHQERARRKEAQRQMASSERETAFT